MTTNEENSSDGRILMTSSAKAPWSVEGALAELPGGAPTAGSFSPLPFFDILGRLKTIKREGWIRSGIPRAEVESISDHMYRMSMIVMFPPPSLSSKIDISRCIKMALFHDLAEALVGDITPMDKVPKEEKNRRESTTMEYFTNNLLGRVNGGIAGKEILNLWTEFEECETLESKFVNDVDKIELLLQMVTYEKAHQHKLDLGGFSWVAKKIVMVEMQEWATEILEGRKDFWGDIPHNSAETLSKDSVLEQEGYYGRA